MFATNACLNSPNLPHLSIAGILGNVNFDLLSVTLVDDHFIVYCVANHTLAVSILERSSSHNISNKFDSSCVSSFSNAWISLSSNTSPTLVPIYTISS